MVNKHFTKFRKGRIRGIIREGTAASYGLNFGDYGLISCEKTKMKKETLEEGRRVLTREMDKQGKLWIRVFPDIALTKKPVGVRMGKGRGKISHHVARIREGMVIFEITGVDEYLARNALMKVEKKMPFNGKFISKPFVPKPSTLT